MRRILLLTTLAAMLAAAMALSGVAQAKPTATSADRQCMKLAIQTLPKFKPAHYTFIGGTEGDDIDTFTATDGPDVFCGFGGEDVIGTLANGDIFIGGADFDGVAFNNGTFYGQEGPDLVSTNEISGIFYGGAGDDVVQRNDGTFYGQEGNDFVEENRGTFDGGDGTADRVGVNAVGCVINVEEGDVGRVC
jgi:Ca2+-binding RTX toxin-like protein